VLEIGIGMGTDNLNLARRGANMHGIDLTPRNLEITKKRLSLYGLNSQLVTADAENLPYADNSMDFIYSFGVIHHSPDTERIISEIHRVLKPGGRCWVTVYNKNSIFFWWSVFFVYYLLLGGWCRRTLKQQLSLIEYPNTDQNMVIRLYTQKQFRALFRNFSEIRSSIRHLLPIDIAGIGYFLKKVFRNPDEPARFWNALGEKFGWYIVINAIK
jgi:ubiquinone/menaquinone biosynthesis C-methylase UbiE